MSPVTVNPLQPTKLLHWLINLSVKNLHLHSEHVYLQLLITRTSISHIGPYRQINPQLSPQKPK